MIIKVNKETLSNAVQPLLGAVSNKNTLAAVEGILITTNGDDACTLTSFDLEKGYRIKIPVKVLESGSFIIGGQRFSQIIRAMPEGEITVSVDSRLRAKIVGGRSEFELSAMDGADFPTLPEFRSETVFSVNQGVLRSMIIRTSFAVAQNESRAALNGAFFSFRSDEVSIVGCDGNRLAVRTQKCKVSKQGEKEPDISLILPGKTLGELLKMLKNEDEDIRITVTRRNAVFESDGLLFFSRLIDGDYLDYGKFIPSSSKISCVIETETFIESLERAFLVSEDKTVGQTKSYVRCKFCEDSLKLSSVSANGRVSDEIYIENKSGQTLEIGFNCRFLLEALKACGSEKVRCEMNTPLSCMVIKPASDSESEDFLYLVLPIRMKD